jgi:hypothetical protein
MKKLVFAAALMVGTAAMAQDAAQDTTAETDVSTQTETTTQTDTTGTAGTMQTTTSAQGGTTVAPGNAAPERDARGIPVVSDPAMAPSGANQPISAPPGARIVASDNQGAVFATQPSTKEYPVCSRTVTDGCVQAYERGAGRPRR